jgi:hypothetical protein
VLAVVVAAVFGASLNGLVAHPVRYGWNWTLLIDSDGGYGSWPPAQMEKLVNGQPGVTGWSTFAFTQLAIDNTEVPAAVLSLAIAILASVRQRRSELALLKALGLTRRQVREVIAWQASAILVIACLVGVPFGVVVGRWAWTSFAASLGVLPVTVIPGIALLSGFAALLVAGNLLATVPASIAARTKPAPLLRAD